MTDKSRKISLISPFFLATIFTALTLFLLSSCGVKDSTEGISGQTAVKAPEPITKQGWEIEWDKTVQAARKEGKVTTYSSTGGEMPRLVSRAFQDKYGIVVEWITLPGGESSTKILKEHAAGLYLVDVISGGTGPWVTFLKPAGILMPLDPAIILPEVKDPKLWWKGEISFNDRDHTIASFSAYNVPPIGYNTQLVRPAEIRTFRDLLDPKWKGKIVLSDPTVPGTGQNLMATIIESKLGEDYLRQLVKQEPVAIRDERLPIEWLAQGKYPLTLVPKPELFEEFQKAGAPLSLKNTEDGVNYLHAGGGQLALIRNAPHPNAAKVFINWLLSRDGGIVVQKAHGRPSGRLDVPKENIEPLTLLPSGTKEIRPITEEFQLKLPEYRKLIRDIFGPLLR